MERGSDKHSRRLDDAMADEAAGIVHGGHDSHIEEWRSAEPSGEDQPEVGLGGDTALTGGTPEGMTPEDVEARSQLASWLGRASFPAVRELLLEHVMDAAPRRRSSSKYARFLRAANSPAAATSGARCTSTTRLPGTPT
jgi:hypothetical protein